MRPLDGIKVIEMAGLTTAPYCGMILSDFGADVIVVDRLLKDMEGMPIETRKSLFERGKGSIHINVKTDKGVAIIRRMIQISDVLLEAYRPGVMENLGLGPEEALGLNSKIIYARLTGWGQNGSYAKMPGHDINFIGLSGALSLFRRKGERPLPPCNVLGDFAGGGMCYVPWVYYLLWSRGIDRVKVKWWMQLWWMERLPLYCILWRSGSSFYDSRYWKQYARRRCPILPGI